MLSREEWGIGLSGPISQLLSVWRKGRNFELESFLLHQQSHSESLWSDCWGQPGYGRVKFRSRVRPSKRIRDQCTCIFHLKTAVGELESLLGFHLSHCICVSQHKVLFQRSPLSVSEHIMLLPDYRSLSVLLSVPYVFPIIFLTKSPGQWSNLFCAKPTHASGP